MISRTTDGFWKLYEALPEQIQHRAKAAYQRFQQDPYHPGLQFKQVHDNQPIYSARISRDYRAVGVKDGDDDLLPKVIPLKGRVSPSDSVAKLLAAYCSKHCAA